MQQEQFLAWLRDKARTWKTVSDWPGRYGKEREYARGCMMAFMAVEQQLTKWPDVIETFTEQPVPRPEAEVRSETRTAFCTLCGAETSEDDGWQLELYVRGSEGIFVCLACRLDLTDCARHMMSLASRLKLECAKDKRLSEGR